VDERLIMDGKDLLALSLTGAPIDQQRRAFEAALSERGVSPESMAVVMRRVRDGVALSPDLPAARTRLGGPALLPVGVEWPGLHDDWHLGFLLLLALEELPPGAGLPPSGTLLVFEEMETMGFEYDPLVATRVFYVPDGEPMVEPPMPEKVLFPMPARPLGARALPIAGEATLTVRELDDAPDREWVIASMNELVPPMLEGCNHSVAGSPIEWRGPMIEELASVLAGAPAETQRHFSASLLAGEGWRLLAQFGPEYDPEIGLDLLGDGSRLYLCIPHEDLPVRRFDRVVGFSQTPGSFGGD
jgi:hypothetical protein